VRIDPRTFGWGVFFVVLGSVPLAVRAGLVTSETAGMAWRLWPLILVGAGVGLLLHERRAAAVGGLVVSVTFGLIGGGLISGSGFDIGAIACGDAHAGGPREARDGTLGANASVSLDQRCGDVNVRMLDGTGWTLAADGGDLAPDITVSSSEVRIRSSQRHVIVFPGFGPRESWDVGLPRGSTIDLDTTLNAGTGHLDLRGGHFGVVGTTVNAGDMRIDLGGATASSLSLTLNAGSTRIVLPASSVTGSVTVNAGSIELCAAPGVGLRFTTNPNITASYDFGSAGLVQSGSTWTSPDYATAAVRIDLSTTANAGSVALNPKDGCR
jgi:hypothetical protein